MDVHASEKEQVEALKKWWKENGSSVITGVLLGLSVLLGGKAWFGYQETQALNASNVYAQMMAAGNASQKEGVQTFANRLISDFSDSSYAVFAALLLAKQAVDDGELEAAEAQLKWALEKSRTEETKNIARVRLLRVMIERAEYTQAEQLLNEVQAPEAYHYLYSELRGDLALARGNQSIAATAYKEALDQVPDQDMNVSLLIAKYESVSVAGDVEQ